MSNPSTKPAMNPPGSLICSCGLTLKTTGATPGRVGRCPSCGARFQVPEAHEVRVPAPLEKAPEPHQPIARRFRPKAAAAPRSRGFLKPPATSETTLARSFLYPFWGEECLALLLFYPPVLWVATLPTIVLFAPLLTGNSGHGFALPAIILGLPFALLTLTLGGYMLLYLGRVLVASAQGEVQHPRWPQWDGDDIRRGLGRWFIALFAGLAVGGLPMMVYWLYCGDIDLFDRIIFVELGTLGAIYALMALMAALLHESPLAANPITVIQAIYRVGWGYLIPCLVAGAAATLSIGLFDFALNASHPITAALGLWACWVITLDLALVVMRILGLFYRRHAAALGWISDRPRWGA
ncbi:hypothetical protein EP7_002800 [Isosphaeraceae bacterium EP7]